MSSGTVIGEVGGSSSRWALLREGKEPLLFPVKGTSLTGFNPLNGDGAVFSSAVRAYFEAHEGAAMHAGTVVVYGAGCGSMERRARMNDALKQLWPDAAITVETDLFGAARGLLGGTAGLVLILGTGMNVGHFDGSQLYRPMPSLGWMLGDEGSGADIGRTLLQDAFYRRMPAHVVEALFGAEGPDAEQVVTSIHRSAFPARELASYTIRLVPLLHEPYVRDLLRSRFHVVAEQLTVFFDPDQRELIAATGSVAYGFRDLLAECLLDRGMSLTVVEQDPLPGLVRYHAPLVG